MNKAFNHGSQGDLLSSVDVNETVVATPVSKAPTETGQLIRDAARQGNYDKLSSLLSKWKGDPVVNEV